jgi:hypothetical protein
MAVPSGFGEAIQSKEFPVYLNVKSIRLSLGTEGGVGNLILVR